MTSTLWIAPLAAGSFTFGYALRGILAVMYERKVQDAESRKWELAKKDHPTQERS